MPFVPENFFIIFEESYFPMFLSHKYVVMALLYMLFIYFKCVTVSKFILYTLFRMIVKISIVLQKCLFQINAVLNFILIKK